MTSSRQPKPEDPLLDGKFVSPAMRHFLIGFAIVEAVLMGWVLVSSQLR